MAILQGTIGIDLGGSKIAVGIVHGSGKILERIDYDTPKVRTPEKIVPLLLKAIKYFSTKYKVLTIGIGVAGQVKFPSGEVFFAPNLFWRKVPLKAMIQEETGLPVFVDNDVRVAAIGEWLYGAGKKQDNLVCVFIGTGIGGGVIVGGTLLRGKNNSACEVGHMVINCFGPLCTCGNYGCWESLFSGWAIEKKFHMSAKDLFKKYQAGDHKIVQFVEEGIEILSIGLANLVNLYNPSLIVLGGGIMEGLSDKIFLIKNKVKKRALQIATKDLKIQKTKLGNDAGIIGASTLGELI